MIGSGGTSGGDSGGGSVDDPQPDFGDARSGGERSGGEEAGGAWGGSGPDGDWQGGTGRAWATEWRRTDRSFGPLTERLLATLRGLVPTQVLDVGCGAGELAMAIARNHPGAAVLGVDISPQLIAVARDRARHLANVRFACADAAQWQPDQGFAPGLVISRHGMMFFADPVSAFAHLARLCAPQARLHFSCFRARALNAFATEVPRLLPEPPPAGDPLAPGPFALAARERILGILEDSGWGEVTLEAVDFPMVVGAGPDPIEDAVGYFARIGPAAPAAAALDADAREAFFARVREYAQRHCHEGIVAIPAAAWLVSARRA